MAHHRSGLRSPWLSVLVLGLAISASTVRGAGAGDDSRVGTGDDVRVNDCGVNSLYLLLRPCSRDVDLTELRRRLPNPRDSGLSMHELRAAAGTFGLRLRGVRIGSRDVPLDRPVIALLEHEGNGHFVVLVPTGETGTMVQMLDFPRPPQVVDYASLLESSEWTGKVMIPSWRHERAMPHLVCLGLGIGVFGIVRFALRRRSPLTARTSQG